MFNLYSITAKKRDNLEDISASEILSVLYHDIFDYPMSLADLIRWQAGDIEFESSSQVIHNRGFFYKEGRDGLVFQRALRSRISNKKMEIAKKVSNLLSFLPGIKMVAVTGSLAMGNSTDGSDIDLMIVTKTGQLWTTRLISYSLLKLFGYSIRKPGDRNEKNKLCLNMWIDESDLVWKKDRNLYTAHEIAQILPLLNRDGTYDRFLAKNKWILKYWPNSIKLEQKNNFEVENASPKRRVVESLCYWLQYRHMRSRITREIVSPTRAIFHPQDWGKVVVSRLSS